jgi:hypothetical protein
MFCNSCDKDISNCFICGEELDEQILCIYMNKVSSELNPMGKGFHFCSTECHDVFKKRLCLMTEPIITSAVDLVVKRL